MRLPERRNVVARRMAVRSATVAAVVALAGITVGCSGQQAAEPSTQLRPSGPAAVSVSAPVADADTVACQRYGTSARTARSVLEGIRNGPVVPAGVSFFLLPVRDAANAAGVRDATLATALKEVVAAVDDLDAQAQAKIPPGSDPVRTTVTIDPTRAIAAMAAVDQACGSRLPAAPPSN